MIGGESNFLIEVNGSARWGSLEGDLLGYTKKGGSCTDGAAPHILRIEMVRELHPQPIK